MKNKIIYFADPLCSWCYGFGPAITEALKAFNDSFDFELVMGGLRPYGTEKMSGLEDMLRHHWEEVHKRTGVTFQYDILKNETFVYDTEPPSRAVIAVKNLSPEKEFEFFKSVQSAFYQDNKDTGDIGTYIGLLDKFEINEGDFTRAFLSEDVKEQTRSSFQYAQELGVRGFPSTVVQFEGQLYLVANGYQDAASLEEGIHRVVAKTAGLQ